MQPIPAAHSAELVGVLFSVVSLMRQVPASAAHPDLIDFSAAREGRFLVLRPIEDAGRAALVEHLQKISAVGGERDARELLVDAPAEPVGLVS